MQARLFWAHAISTSGVHVAGSRGDAARRSQLLVLVHAMAPATAAFEGVSDGDGDSFELCDWGFWWADLDDRSRTKGLEWFSYRLCRGGGILGF